MIAITSYSQAKFSNFILFTNILSVLKYAYYFIIVYFFISSCSSNRSTNNYSDEIQIINILIREDRLSELFLIDRINSAALEEFLVENIHLDTNGHYHEFGPLRTIGSEVNLDSIFDFDNVQEIKSKIRSDFNENWTQANFRPPLTTISLANFKNKKNDDIGILKISKPLIFDARKYALLSYSATASSKDTHGVIYTLLFQKFEDQWEIINRYPF